MLERLFSRLELKIPPPVVIVFAGLLNRLGRDWGQVPFDPPWILIISLIVVSGVLGVGGLIGCFRGRTTVHPWSPDETTTIVTHGVYSFSRNTMYLGLLLLLAAY
jgi:protein-S-isoprenylcysteine O-methyltransferase Ste14